MPPGKASGPPSEENACHTAKSCILYQNDGRDVVLIDVPKSIASAQGAAYGIWRQSLLSCLPLESPFPSNEPKSGAARASLHANIGNEHETALTTTVAEALKLIAGSHYDEWCLPRSVAQQALWPSRKRRADEALNAVSPDVSLEGRPSVQAKPLPSDLLQDLANEEHDKAFNSQMISHDSGNLTETDYDFSESWTRFQHNSTEEVADLQIMSKDFGIHKFSIPPKSAFFMSDCANSTAFHAAVRNLASEQDTSRKFDFILMDPPWPNASVKRASKTGASSYKIAASLWELRQLIYGMDVDVLLAREGLLGVWVTNKPAVRELVLGDDGFFASWGVELEEEWIWIKTTKTGEPVTSLDALWRKPYEILLLGRKRKPESEHAGGLYAPKRRVIAGVPDLHSRKPCIKELIQPLLPNPEEYRALEIFARNLVAGWWSWGNEVLKFNHEGCWSSWGG